MAMKKMTGGSESVKKTKTMPKAAKLMGAPASARQKVAKMTTTKSRGSNTKVQVGNQNQIESTRVNKNYPDKTTTAQAKTTKRAPGVKGMFNKNEATAGFVAQRAGGSKNLSSKEMGAKAKIAAGSKGVANKPKGSLKSAKTVSAPKRGKASRGR
jgi:hypothetical protein